MNTVCLKLVGQSIAGWTRSRPRSRSRFVDRMSRGSRLHWRIGVWYIVQQCRALISYHNKPVWLSQVLMIVVSAW